VSGPTIDGPTVSAAGASRVVEAAVRRAEELGVAVVVWVVDPGGHDVAMLRMDGAPLLSRQVARDKAWSSVAFGQPTTWWATIIDDDPGLAALGRGNRLMPVAGGVPLRVGSALVGGLGVSGASAEQDGDIADTGAAALAGTD
jgi:glc operon protein GlcG